MKYCLVLIGLIFSSLCFAQHQLVVIKRDEVTVRYLPGDQLVYKRKSANAFVKASVIAINDSTIITSADTLATHQIERLRFKKGNFGNVVGSFLVTGGVAIFVIDQVNTLLVRQEEASLSNSVTTISATAIAIGLPLMLIKKNSHRMGFKNRLRIINQDSPFYYSDKYLQPKGYISPHIPRN